MPKNSANSIMLRISTLFLAFTAVASGFAPAFVPKAQHSRDASLQMTATTAAADEVKVGDKIPSVTLMEGQADYGKPEEVDLAELIAGKKVAIFAVPGAFTPGCSKSHLPSFIEAQAELKEKGIELTICVATNDAFVMEVSEYQTIFYYIYILFQYSTHHFFLKFRLGEVVLEEPMLELSSFLTLTLSSLKLLA